MKMNQLSNNSFQRNLAILSAAFAKPPVLCMTNSFGFRTNGHWSVSPSLVSNFSHDLLPTMEMITKKIDKEAAFGDQGHVFTAPRMPSCLSSSAFRLSRMETPVGGVANFFLEFVLLVILILVSVTFTPHSSQEASSKNTSYEHKKKKVVFVYHVEESDTDSKVAPGNILRTPRFSDMAQLTVDEGRMKHMRMMEAFLGEMETKYDHEKMDEATTALFRQRPVLEPVKCSLSVLQSSLKWKEEDIKIILTKCHEPEPALESIDEEVSVSSTPLMPEMLEENAV
jgi:hypothetical protein